MSKEYKLKYLFVAEFTDGTFLKQTPDDKSSFDPEKRSQFYDVLQSKKTLRRFSLVENKLLGNTIAVDLQTGVFYVNGLALLLESEKLPTLPKKFTLIFYRQHTHDMNVTVDLNQRDVTDMKEASHYCEYFLGWQVNIKGKNYQQKLAVS